MAPRLRPRLPLAGPLHSFEKTRSAHRRPAHFIVERQLARRGTCTLTVPAFDGRALYNLRFTDAERERLSADGHQNFAGPSQVCEIAREDFVVDADRNEDTYRRGKIWYTG